MQFTLMKQHIDSIYWRKKSQKKKRNVYETFASVFTCICYSELRIKYNLTSISIPIFLSLSSRSLSSISWLSNSSERKIQQHQIHAKALKSVRRKNIGFRTESLILSFTVRSCCTHTHSHHKYTYNILIQWEQT